MAIRRILASLLTAVSITSAFTIEEQINSIQNGCKACEIPQDQPFKDVLNHINAQISHAEANQCEEVYLAAASEPSLGSNILSFMFGSSKGESEESPDRDYSRAPTKIQKDAIIYIFTSLAKFTKTELFTHRSSINSAGKKIEDIHPLVLLSYLFGEDDLRGCMESMHERGGMVWGKFTKGLFKSLREEKQKGNLTRAQINDFAKNLKIKPAPFHTAIEDNDWSGFVSKLFEQLPRKGTPRRY